MHVPALLLLGAGLAAAHPAADPYTRQTGIDAIHYTFQLTLNDSTDQIEGTATVAIRFVQRGTTSFWLDLASQGLVARERSASSQSADHRSAPASRADTSSSVSSVPAAWAPPYGARKLTDGIVKVY